MKSLRNSIKIAPISYKGHTGVQRAFLYIVVSFAVGFSDTAYSEVEFERDIASILVKRCIECHDAKQKKGGLDLTSGDGLRKGGESGISIKAGHPNSSLLIEKIKAGEMPPPSKGISQLLPELEIKALVDWVEAGANWPADRLLDLYERTTDLRGGRDWWSFQPIVKSSVPIQVGTAGVANEVDSFILSRLNQVGLTPAAPAPKLQLVRRLYFDLTGLPPAPDAVARFVGSVDAGTYELLVDELLASPEFGERWARHWLDLVRFAETCGYERDQLKPNIWKYRDWVIDAFNSDMPYDKFIRDQLAGDEVEYRDEQTLIATGMIRAGTWNDEPNDPADYQYTRLEDMVHTTSSAFIGLTVKCARCHDHKFDPIRQTDYYRFANAFWSGYIGQANLGGPSEEELGSSAFGWTDRGRDVAPLHLLINGEREKPGELVVPASISTIPKLSRTFTEPSPDAATTTQRLQLAQWLTDGDHPLTARVIVNRLWQHTMGEALVRTPNNFGFKGDLPTHPKLLDYLASELIDNGWHLKPIIKMIVMSNTYRQASSHLHHAEYAEKDYLNKTWWRAKRKRLDAEQLRDSILATSGQLNLSKGGASFYPQMSTEALEGLSRKAGAWGTSPLHERNRRSIYMMTKRSRLLPLMTTFNFTDTTLPCGQRDITTVATQSLALLNNEFVHDQSLAFADRLIKQFPANPKSQIIQAWQLATGRTPTADEFEVSLTHLTQQHKEYRGTLEIGPTEQLTLTVKNGLSIWLDAGQRIETDKDGRVISWGDASGSSLDGQHPIDAVQGETTTRPLYVANSIGNRPSVRFDGKTTHLKLTASPLSKQQFTFVIVAQDQSKADGHRELISNWNSRGRSTNSLFLGITKGGTVRLSDAFSDAGQLLEPQEAFILTGTNTATISAVYQNGAILAESGPLTKRVLEGPWVVGTQGNINGEFWLGDISELMVFERQLSRTELRKIWSYLALKYGVALRADGQSPERYALASLCHVLFNTNEFIYLD